MSLRGGARRSIKAPNRLTDPQGSQRRNEWQRNRCVARVEPVALLLDRQSALALAPVGKVDGDCHAAAVCSVTAAAITVRNADVPLETPGKTVDLYLAGLVEIGPGDCKRDRLTFADELVRICSIGYLNAPAGKWRRQDFE